MKNCQIVLIRKFITSEHSRVKKLRQLFSRKQSSSTRKSEPLTAHKVDMSFRIFWTKITREWELDKIKAIREKVIAVAQAPDFRKNPIERQYTVEGLDEYAHSGASLLALIDVLNALESYYETNEENN